MTCNAVPLNSFYLGLLEGWLHSMLLFTSWQINLDCRDVCLDLLFAYTQHTY